MNDRPNPTTRNRGATWVGLFIALFGILIVRAAVYAFYPPYSFSAAIWRESLNWLCTIALLLIIRFGERLPFRSVGFGRATLLQSLGWGGGHRSFACFVGVGIVALTHYTGGSSGAALAKLPVWLVTLIVVRAVCSKNCSIAATPLNVCKRSASTAIGREQSRW